MAFEIDGIQIGGNKVVVIAEAGVNHLGRLDYAEELIKTAARAGADIVKFQTYKADKLTTPNAPRFWSWDGELDESGSQRDSYSNLDSFGRTEYQILMSLCKKYKIGFLSTPFDNDSVDMLVELGMQGFKVASCDITNIPFLTYMAAKKLPMLLSTGASTIQEIALAVETIRGQGNDKICLMHCTLCYPTNDQDANLSAILDINKNFPDYVIGLSDHTLGTLIPAASVLYGVKVIEKHYTFDKTLPFSADHWLSLDEQELSIMVEQIKILQSSIGCGKKVLLDCELPAHKYARRSLVAARFIDIGDVITEDMITEKRPGTGLSPVYKERIIGSKAIRQIQVDDLLSMSDFI